MSTVCVASAAAARWLIFPAPMRRNAPPLQSARRAAGKLDRSGSHGRGPVREHAASASPGADRVTEQTIQDGTDRGRCSSHFHRVADLAQDLSLADDGRVEPAATRKRCNAVASPVSV